MKLPKRTGDLLHGTIPVRPVLGREAVELEAIRERRYLRVDPRHGGKLHCPSSRILPSLP